MLYIKITFGAAGLNFKIGMPLNHKLKKTLLADVQLKVAY